MSGSRIILIILILMGICSCSSQSYRSKLIPKNKKQVLNNVYGAYTIVTFEHKPEFEGELIGVRNDTLHVLGEFGFLHSPADSVRSVMLILTENNAQKYLIWTLLATALPLLAAAAQPDYAGSFAILAIPAFVLGMLAYLIENNREPHLVSYPGDVMEMKMLNEYSRFPSGIPDDLSLPTLHKAQ